MARPRCKDLVLRMLEENPIAQFDALQMGKAIRVKFGHEFSHGTVRGALNALFKEGRCESYYGKHGPDGFYLKSRQDATEEELAREEERHAAWQVRIQADWKSRYGRSAPKNLSGPSGLWPEDVDRAEARDREASDGRV